MCCLIPRRAGCRSRSPPSPRCCSSCRPPRAARKTHRPRRRPPHPTRSSPASTAVKSMAGQEEVRARHILVEGEDEAKAIIEQLKGGADFATLAKEKSKDPGAAEGGDLGYFTKDQMVPEFADVAFKMYPGQLSNPVKTQFGWHVIKVEDKRTRQPPEFEKVKDQIEAYLARKVQSDFIAKLRQSAKVERLDKAAEQNKN